MHSGSGIPSRPALAEDAALASGQAIPESAAATPEPGTPVEPGKTAGRPAHSLRWRGIGVRLLILLAAGFLVVFLAREWDWWTGSAVQQRTDDAYLQADLTPLAAKS